MFCWKPREQPTRSYRVFVGSRGGSRRGVIAFSLEAAGAADEELWRFRWKPREQPTRSYGVFAGSRGREFVLGALGA